MPSKLSSHVSPALRRFQTVCEGLRRLQTGLRGSATAPDRSGAVAGFRGWGAGRKGFGGRYLALTVVASRWV